mmetsp:Transcript_24887/g.61553  ORF Transcript_24887/g.61553 Transcript_24887/m.61553 type:complete len:114 (-) Transcript_24887:223-564(-)
MERKPSCSQLLEDGPAETTHRDRYLNRHSAHIKPPQFPLAAVAEKYIHNPLLQKREGERAHQAGSQVLIFHANAPIKSVRLPSSSCFFATPTTQTHCTHTQTHTHTHTHTQCG